MNYLSVENLSKSYNEQALLENLSFGISKGDKTALIAVNGAGKTTLMRILAGKELPDSGRVVFAEGVRVGFLEQAPDFDPTLSISELINGTHNEVLQCIRAYESYTQNNEDQSNNEQYVAGLAVLTSRMDALRAWDYERRLKELLNRFDITQLDQLIGSLSGGQLKRLALALVLLDEPELLLLDEPTNHLDIEMIEWLERYLRQINVTLLMVTHDRYFLDRICNNILELYQQQLYLHKGNFTYYLEKSEEREKIRRVEAEKAGQLLKQETEWMRRMPKARTTKSKSRIDAFYELKEKAHSYREPKQLNLELSMNRIGSKILEMRNVSKSYGETVILDGFDYMFTKGERIGIIGDNGVGKTTFLNLLTGTESPDGGRVIPGDTIVFGYYTQKGIQFDSEKKIIDVVKEIADIIELGNGRTATASQLLTRFMFPPPVQNQTVASLSGGEKRRLYLLTVLVRNPNFLILDEPTNDLDLITLQTLEDFIRSFPGCLLIVSHDRYFMDQVVDQLFVFEGNASVRGFTGTYSDYREAMDELERENKQRLEAEKQAQQKKHAASASNATKDGRKQKRSYKEQKEYEQLEQQIAGLEAEKLQLLAQLNDASAAYQQLDELSKRIMQIDEELEASMLRWMELDEIETTA